MQASIRLEEDRTVQYVLRIADTCLILGQRLSEWCGHAPILEEDLALANMALDLIGQSRALLSHAGELTGQGYDEDQLAFLREERDYLNVTLVELPRGDFAVTVVRNTMVSTFLKILWQRLAGSTDQVLAAIAAKAVKEARYHQQHAADWLVRLAGGTDESRRRLNAALQDLWPFVQEFFEADAVDVAAAAEGLGPNWAALKDAWIAEVTSIAQAGGIQLPAQTRFRSSGKQGRHSEHLGFMLAEMQYLQRAYPGGVW